MTSVEEGVTYQFRVCAENACGPGKFSPPSDPYLCEDPVFKPSPPRNVVVEDTTNSSVLLAWDIPQSDGGDAKLTYIIEQRLEDGSWSKCNDKDLSILKFNVENLREGRMYSLRVKSCNKAGHSTPVELPEVSAREKTSKAFFDDFY